MSFPLAEVQGIPGPGPSRKPCQKFEGHTKCVLDVAHVPGRRQIITCSQDGSLRLWNLDNTLQIGKAWRDGKSAVFTMSLSPDGKTVASGSDDGAVRLWEVDTGKMIAKWTGHRRTVLSICWNRDGKRVVSGSADGAMRVWDVESADTILGPINTGHDTVFAVVYSPDEIMIATGGGGNDQVKIWNAQADLKLVRTLKGHTEPVLCLAWAADGLELLSGSDDASIRMWNTSTWKQSAVLTEHHHAIRAIAISPNGRILVSASFDDTARLWDIKNGLPISSPLQHVADVCCISFSVDGGLLVTGCDDNNAYAWDVSAIVKEAGSGHLLLDSDTPQDPVRKSVLDSDASRHLAKPPNNASDETRKLPQGFFHDTGDRIHSSSAWPLQSSSVRQSSASRARALLGRFPSLFRSPHSTVRDAASHDMSSPPHRFNSSLSYFTQRHRPDSEQRPPEVEVPFTRGQARNIRVAKKTKRTIPVPKNIMNINVSGPSIPMQQSVDAPGQKSWSQSQIVASTAPVTTAAAITTSATALPSQSEFPSDMVVVRQAGCWTRFWLFLGCISVERRH